MNVIEVDNLTKDYGQGRGIFNVSFNISEGEVFGFLGPNGAGKSTTIRHLMGFSKADSGSARIFNKDCFRKYNEILSDVGYIPGEIALPQGLTGWEFIYMMQQLQGKKNDKLLKELLNLFALDPTGETKRMSLGVKRKLAVVTAFMSDPKVLILDEPTSGLDPVMQEVFIDYIKKEKNRGKTILLSSHIFSEVDATCERIAIIKDGRIVSDFIADDLKHSKTKTYCVTTKKADFNNIINEMKNSNTINFIESNYNNCSIRFSVDDENINGAIFMLNKYNIANFTHEKETLEDYFMNYYKEDLDYKGVL